MKMTELRRLLTRLQERYQHRMLQAPFDSEHHGSYRAKRDLVAMLLRRTRRRRPRR